MSANASPSSPLHVSIASCALEHYRSLPNHGKPRLGQEWTVFAALVVATFGGNEPYVVCSATGSKCTTTGPEGWCLRDLHAEVLVKRGLQRILWKEIRSGNLTLLRKQHQPSSSKHDDDASSRDDYYELKPEIELHMFISDSPCGDSTIYELNNGDMNFTGAKLIVEGRATTSNAEGGDDGRQQLCCHNNATVTREGVQQLGQLRIKSGRSNLPSHLRSTSLSCSDKILQWTLLGLQGSLLPVHPIRLSSIVVSRDPHAKSKEEQHQALERAIVDRKNRVATELMNDDEFGPAHAEFLQSLHAHRMTVSVVDQVFDSAKSQLVMPFQSESSSKDVVNENGKRTKQTNNSKPKKNASPCGFCLNWQKLGCDDKVEVLVGNRGTKQGKKPSTEADYEKQASRLCRHVMHAPEQQESYRKWKESRAASGRKEIVFKTQPLKGWMKSIRDFTL